MINKNGEKSVYIPYNGSSLCTQCNLPIEEGDKVFLDATGFFHQEEGKIETGDICIYHYGCIIEE